VTKKWGKGGVGFSVPGRNNSIQAKQQSKRTLFKKKEEETENGEK